MSEFVKKIWQNEEYRNGILTVGIIIGTIMIFRYFLPLVVPFLFAFLFAGIFRPLVDWLIRRVHCSEKTASIVVLLAVGGVLMTLGRELLIILYRQIENFVIYLPFYREQFLSGLGNCCRYIDSGFHLENGASLSYATDVLTGIFSDFQTTVLPKLTASTVTALKRAFTSCLFLFVMFYATLCTLKNYPRLFRTGKLSGYLQRVWERVVHLLGMYIRAEGTIALIQILICSIGLSILENPYSVLLAVFIGLIDAVPVFGSGTVLLPWSVYRLLTGDMKMGIGLLLIYLSCTCNRQLLEPRLLGKHLGMSTLLTLFLIYVGYRLFGVFGFLLGPVGYLMGREILDIVNEKPAEAEKPETE